MLRPRTCGGHPERSGQQIQAVIFQNRYLPDAELVYSFAAADAVLINQSATLNSGTLLLALSMNRPTIAPAKGSIVELAESVGRDGYRPFPGSSGPTRFATVSTRSRAMIEAAKLRLIDLTPKPSHARPWPCLHRVLATRRSTNSAVTPSAAPATAASIGGARITAASIRSHHNARDRKWGRQ